MAELQPGTAVVIRDGSVLHGRFGVVTRSVGDRYGAAYVIRVYTKGPFRAGHTLVTFRSADIRVIGGRHRRKRAAGHTRRKRRS